MKHLFVPYEIALRLKELGFDEPCLGHYQDNIEMFSHTPIKGVLKLGFLGECKSEPYDWNNAPKWGVKSQVFYSAPLYQQVLDFAYLQGKTLQYRPGNRAEMDKEIREWLESTK